MTDTAGGSLSPQPQQQQQQRRVPPMITLPPQPSFETLFSPGPMTLVSNFFSDYYSDVVDCPSFSQLLAGAIASPASGFLNSPGFLSPLQSPFGMSHQQALAHVTAQAALSQSYFNNINIHPENRMVNAVNEKSDIEYSQIGSPDEFSDVTEPRQMTYVYTDTNDGYNWRKYGQKQVKASEHPRSYYKCTYANCPVKKKVGQSLDGHITDIVYKGQHIHDQPQPQPNKETRPIADQGCNQFMIIDELDDEPNPKRRNMEVGPLSNKMVSEPKIVVQTRSEVDLLDDGFKWRKYGQKVVKGNTNPRSYYKCTFGGCNVRKHVERAPSDPKSVVTTYEGKHNHDIPVSKHRGYINNNGMGKSTKPSQRKDTKLGNNERLVMLQMKEEAITV